MVKTILYNSYFLFSQIRRVLFLGKFYIFLIIALLWEAAVSIIGYVSKDPMPLGAVFYTMNLIPMLILGLYLSMTCVSFEKENRTIETLFTIPGSPYKVWLYKLSVQFIVLLLVLILIAGISFVFVQDFPIEVMVINVFILVFFTANINFFFSIIFKSGYTGGLITVFILVILMILSQIDPIRNTAWNFYINPFSKPANLDLLIWNERLLYNKLGIAFFGSMFMYFGLSRLRNREPFI